jgi:SSS family solute:Na+ symporter
MGFTRGAEVRQAITEDYLFTIDMMADETTKVATGRYRTTTDAIGSLEAVDTLYWPSTTTAYGFKATAGSDELSAEQSTKVQWLLQDRLEGQAEAGTERYLTAKNDHEAKKAAYIGVLMSVPIWALFMFIGTALFAFYHAQGAPALPADIKADEVFPYFIAHELPVGIRGLIIAALAAAAISSLDSDLNCLSAIAVEDYYKRFRKNVTDRQQLRFGRWMVVLAGIGALGVAILYISWGGEGVLGALFSLYAIFSAGIVGIFMLGLFSRRANKQGLYIGIAAAVLFTAYAVLTSTKVDIHGTGVKETLLDLGDWNFTHHKYMLGVYSHLIVLIVGYVASLFFKTPLADKELTIYGYLEEKKKQQQ